jgi:hypothetical protein
LPPFLLGSAATVVSTLVALYMFPLSSLGENGWKIAAALCARHIGGAINFVAVAAVTQIDQALVSAALAADNLICALYFTALYALARNIPPDSKTSETAASSAYAKVTPKTLLADLALPTHFGECSLAFRCHGRPEQVSGGEESNIARLCRTSRELQCWQARQLLQLR